MEIGSTTSRLNPILASRPDFIILYRLRLILNGANLPITNLPMTNLLLPFDPTTNLEPISSQSLLNTYIQSQYQSQSQSRTRNRQLCLVSSPVSSFY